MQLSNNNKKLSFVNIPNKKRMHAQITPQKTELLKYHFYFVTTISSRKRKKE
jgi:hypothetical protein